MSEPPKVDVVFDCSYTLLHVCSLKLLIPKAHSDGSSTF